MENSKYYEFNIAPKNENKQRLLKNIFIFLQIIDVLLLAVSFITAFMWFNIFWLFVLAFSVSLYFITKLKAKYYNFYDVFFIDGDISVENVINNEKRKVLVRFTTKEISKIGCMGGETYNNYITTKTVKKLYTIDEYTDSDICIFIDKGEKFLLLLPYNEKFLTYILRYTSAQKLDKDFIQKIKNS